MLEYAFSLTLISPICSHLLKKCSKIPLIRPGRIYIKAHIWWAYIRGKGRWSYIRGKGGKGAVVYIREEKHFNLQFVKPTFLSFFQYKARILAFFMSWKLWNIFKVKNKDIVDVVLASLLLTLNKFDFLLQCFYCWLWSVNYQLGLLLVVLTLCVC